MSAVDLLPCPFCGEAEWIRRTHINSGYAVDRYETGCWNCHASISADTQQIADAYWNRRVNQAHIPPNAVKVGDDTYAWQADEETPEWTEEEFRRAEPAPSFLARIFGKGGKP